MKTVLNWTVRQANTECAYGRTLTRDEIPADHAEWIDTAILDGDAVDGDTVNVSGTIYRLTIR